MRQDHQTLRVDRVRARMVALNLDQLHLAERAGMTSGAISRLLSSGGGHVSSLKAIAEALECSADYLIGLSDDATRIANGPTRDVPAEVGQLWKTLDEDAAAETIQFMRFKAYKRDFSTVDERGRRQLVGAPA